ncbi:guanylate cyclase 32E-like [Haliotis rufescens]|uniref:guanylate cyclase 32E-like n=1 Tax=Haliotis rufescens TaxID=6454 RepID=UPI00201E78E7|nr:guanylate cyclase 32E-like [Haliotis rufescens]
MTMCPRWSRLLLLLTAFGYGLLAKDVIKVGFITTIDSPEPNKAEGRRIAGAMAHAVNTVNDNPDILPNHTLQYVFADNRDNEFVSVNELTEQWRNGAVAFFGPEDFCETEAKVAASWNLPVISYKCDDAVVSDKKEFPTFARTQPPSSHSATQVMALMRYYGWSKFTIVVEKNDLMVRAAENLKYLAEFNNMTVNDLANFTGPYSHSHNLPEISAIVMRTYLRTRVYVLYSRIPAFIDFVRFLNRLGLTDTGEYVVIGIRDDETYNPESNTDFIFRETEYESERTVEDVMAFQPVLQLQSRPPTNPNYTQWQDEVRSFLYRPPINLPPPPPLHVLLNFKVKVTIFAAYLYDAVLVYARAIHELLNEGGDPKNGTAVFEKIRNRTYESIEGHQIYIDEKGDAEANYTVLALRRKNNTFGFDLKPVGWFFRDSSNKYIEFVEDLPVYGPSSVPLDEPLCGYGGERCKPVENYVGFIVGGCLGGLSLIAAIIMLTVYRNWRYEMEVASLIWKIDLKDIQQQPGAAFSVLSFVSNTAGVLKSHTSLSFGQDRNEQKFTKAGVYRSTLVAMKLVKKRQPDLTREVKLELKQMRDLRHDNIVQFIGACVEPNEVYVITEYCSKGSLEDILENDDVKLDTMFIASIVADILKGMVYLHQSDVGSHGDLKSSNCLVDSRWVVKISDFGLNKFKSGQEIPYHGEHAHYKRSLWMAPELLRLSKPLRGGTQKGDVYSFGIVLYEILLRVGPWGECHLTPKEIVEKVKAGTDESGIYFRPNLSRLTWDCYVIDVIKDCWDEDPEERPDFKTVRKMLRPMQKGMKSNIFDNMMIIMERYANNLEAVVAERTVELAEEKKKTDLLLYRMLPKSVAAQLVRGHPVIPEAFDLVTIYFSDICGFTALSAESTPLQVVDLLNDLYTLFDSIIKNYDVYKVETIGDAYMVVSGLPNRNGDNHAGEIASMSLHLLTAIKQFKMRHKPDQVLKLRIGLHSGPCVAGVVGLTMPRYCLFGDTVNTSSRMESNGEALRVHVSPTTRALLDKLGGYYLEERGLIAMKGKGEIRTHWLLGEDKKVREKRTRNSDDSGVHLDAPDTSDTQDTPQPPESIAAFNTKSFNPCLRPSLIFEKKKPQFQPRTDLPGQVDGSSRSEPLPKAEASTSGRSHLITVSEYQPNFDQAEIKPVNRLLPILRTNGSNSSKESGSLKPSGSNNSRVSYLLKTNGSSHSSRGTSSADIGSSDRKCTAVPLVQIDMGRFKEEGSMDSSTTGDTNSSGSRQPNTVKFSDDDIL